ncbi:MAG: redox-sensing transcriptional repressor Rex [Christensenellales bacterium]|jgi:redox-sensing transcriptional repressor
MGISEPTLRRLPLYYKAALEEKENGETYISCTIIAQKLDLIPILIRKDLQQTGIIGRPKIGYSLDELIQVLENTLGYKHNKKAVLVGVGNLGTALTNYPGFEQYGLTIAALIDSNPDKIGKKIKDMTICSPSDIKKEAKRISAQIGIIATPADTAQQVAQLLVDAGIAAIWNFAPIRLSVPDNIVVENVNFAVSLSVLNSKLLLR